MPRETYLPVGMGGKIICPVQAEPPVLYVNWTKDGASLDLEQVLYESVYHQASYFIVPQIASFYILHLDWSVSRMDGQLRGLSVHNCSK